MLTILIAGTLIAVIWRPGAEQKLTPFKSALKGRGSGHQGYDTAAGLCPDCHDINRAGQDYPMTPQELANYFCTSCHLPKVPVPDPTMMMRFSDKAAEFSFILNSVASAISVYQKNPDRPAVSGHKALTCLNCHQVHARAGESVDDMILKNPLTPQANSVEQEPLALENWAIDGAVWCRACHPEVASSNGHNHPDYLCLQCHEDTGNPSALGTAEFPHSSDNPALLTAEPDVLCLSCHVRRSIP